MLDIISLALVALWAPNLVAADGGTCKTFTPDSSPASTYTIPADSPITISNSIICNGSELGTQFPPSMQSITHPCNSTQCAVWIPMDYAVEMHSKSNFSSLSNDTQDNLLQLIQDTVYYTPISNMTRTDFNRTIVRKVGISEGWCAPEGSKGHYILTPYYLCTNGVLSGCSGDDALTDNTSVQACGIALLQAGPPNGHINFLQSGDQFGNAAAPPNATAPPGSISTSDTNGASSFRGAEGVGFLSLGIILMLLL